MLPKFTDLYKLATNSVKQPPKFDNDEQEGIYSKTSDVHTATSWWKLQSVFGRHEHSTFIGKIFSNLDRGPTQKYGMSNLLIKLCKHLGVLSWSAKFLL